MPVANKAIFLSRDSHSILRVSFYPRPWVQSDKVAAGLKTCSGVCSRDVNAMLKKPISQIAHLALPTHRHAKEYACPNARMKRKHGHNSG